MDVCLVDQRPWEVQRGKEARAKIMNSRILHRSTYHIFCERDAIAIAIRDMHLYNELNIAITKLLWIEWV